MTPNLEVLKFPKNCERSGPGMLSLKGPIDRRMSMGFAVSTLTTVAPWSARYFTVIGPTPTQEKSAILIPSNGSESVTVTLYSAAEPQAAAVSAGERPNKSPKTSWLCSPRLGAQRRTFMGVSDRRANIPGTWTSCPLGSGAASQ